MRLLEGNTHADPCVMENADARGNAPDLSLSQNINPSRTTNGRFDSIDFDAITSKQMTISDVASLIMSLPDFELSRPEVVWAFKRKAANKYKKL